LHLKRARRSHTVLVMPPQELTLAPEELDGFDATEPLLKVLHALPVMVLALERGVRDARTNHPVETPTGDP
jgi:hypothetical protein